MNGPSPLPMFGARLADLHDLCRDWGWFLALGVLLIVLGAIALGAVVVATLASVLVLGWLLVAGGIIQVVHAFWARRWGGFFLAAFIGVLEAVVGLFVLAHPLASAAGLTLLLAIALTVGGVFRIAVALAARFEGWGWLLLSGALGVLMGGIILTQLPESALWVLGLFLGVDLITNGVWFVSLALAARRVCKATAPPAV